MSKVFVKYGFIFDPKYSWEKLTEFEQDLAETFKQRGLKAELVEKYGFQVSVSPTFRPRDDGTWSVVLESGIKPIR